MDENTQKVQDWLAYLAELAIWTAQEQQRVLSKLGDVNTLDDSGPTGPPPPPPTKRTVDGG